MSKIVRAAVIALLVAVPTFGAAAGASATTLRNGIGWDQAPTAAVAAVTAQAAPSAVSPADGIGWD